MKNLRGKIISSILSLLLLFGGVIGVSDIT